jgi:hypothetical protein
MSQESQIAERSDISKKVTIDVSSVLSAASPCLGADKSGKSAASSETSLDVCSHTAMIRSTKARRMTCAFRHILGTRFPGVILHFSAPRAGDPPASFCVNGSQEHILVSHNLSQLKIKLCRHHVAGGIRRQRPFVLKGKP